MSKPEFESYCHHNNRCGLTGSSAFFASIPKSFVMINGPLWCYFYAMKHVDDENKNAATMFYCTQPSPASLVYGTEKDITDGLSYVKTVPGVDRVFLMNNCSIGLIGDDLKGIARKFGGPWPVYTMDSGGLKGNFEKGFANAFLRVVEEMKPLPVKPAAVNVLGLSDVSLKGREDAREIRRILSMAGISVISTPGCAEDWDTIMKAPEAAVNLVARDELALPAAEEMKNRFGTPYLQVGLPYGYEGTLHWIRQVVEGCGFGNPKAVREEVDRIRPEVMRRGSYLASLWGSLWFDQVLVAAPPSEAIGMADALRNEWLDTANLTIHLQMPTTYHTDAADAVRTLPKDDALVKEDYEQWKGGLVLSSSEETANLERMKKPFASVHIARPSHDELMITDLPLCGIRGAGYLYERVWNAILREMR